MSTAFLGQYGKKATVPMNRNFVNYQYRSLDNQAGDVGDLDLAAMGHSRDFIEEIINSPKGYYAHEIWVTGDGRRLLPYQMESAHLVNTIKYCISQVKNETRHLSSFMYHPSTIDDLQQKGIAYLEDLRVYTGIVAEAFHRGLLLLRPKKDEPTKSQIKKWRKKLKCLVHAHANQLSDLFSEMEQALGTEHAVSILSEIVPTIEVAEVEPPHPNCRCTIHFVRVPEEHY